MLFFFDKQRYLDKEGHIDVKNPEDEKTSRDRLLNTMIKEFLIENKICSEDLITLELLLSIRGIDNEIFNIKIFYENWSVNRDRLTIIGEFTFYKRKLRRTIKGIIKANKKSSKLAKLGKIVKKLRKSRGRTNISRNRIEKIRDLPSKKKYVDLADSNFESKNYSSAINYYDKALKIDRKDWNIYNKRGMAKMKTGNLLEAKEDFKISVALNPNNPLLYYNRGQASEYTGDLNSAREDYAKAKEYLEKFILPAEHVTPYLENIRELK